MRPFFLKTFPTALADDVLFSLCLGDTHKRVLFRTALPEFWVTSPRQESTEAVKKWGSVVDQTKLVFYPPPYLPLVLPLLIPRQLRTMGLNCCFYSDERNYRSLKKGRLLLYPIHIRKVLKNALSSGSSWHGVFSPLFRLSLSPLIY